MAERPLVSLALRLKGANYLLDCGEGTQMAYKKLHVGVRALRVIAVSHLHADHCLGLPGLLMLRSQMEDPGPLTCIGPAGLESFVRHVISDLACTITYPIDFVEIEHQKPTRDTPLQEVYRDENLRVLYFPLEHSVFCVGYRIEENARPGRFDPQKAKKLGLTPGPDFGRIQRGEAVQVEDGRLVQPSDVLGPERRGRSVGYCTDTARCRGLYRLLEEVDLAVLEGMFLPEHSMEADRKQHMQVEDAIRIASRSKALQSRLVHFSPRYGAEEVEHIDALALSVSPSIRAARDGELIELPLPD